MKKLLKKLLTIFPKIIIHPSKKKIITKNKWLIKLSNFYYFIIKIFPKYPIRLFLSSYINKVKKMIDDDNYLKIKKLWLCAFNNCNDKTKLFISKMFYLSEIFDNDISLEIMNFAKNTNDKNIRYWTTMDICQMAFVLQKGYYPNFYLDRKELFKQIALELDYEEITNVKHNNDTLCIITYQLSGDLHNSMQRVASMVSNGLSKYYSEIIIITIEAFKKSSMPKKSISTIFGLNDSILEEEKIKAFFPSNATIKYACGNNPHETMRSALKLICDCNASALIDISDEYSPISYFYNKYYSAYYIPMRNYASSSFFHKAVGKKWKYELVNNVFHSISNDSISEWSFPEYVPKKENFEITKKDIGFNSDCFVILSIGNNNTIFSNSFVDEICSLIAEEEKIVWLFVGENAPDYLHYKYKELIKNKKIIERGYENNLYNLCSACDVLLRANTTGGSGGTAIAAMSKLPIVMTNYICDPMRWLGKDFSNMTSALELKNHIRKLFLDRDFYKNESMRSYSKVIEATNTEKIWDDLYIIINNNKRLENE